MERFKYLKHDGDSIVKGHLQSGEWFLAWLDGYDSGNYSIDFYKTSDDMHYGCYKLRLRQLDGCIDDEAKAIYADIFKVLKNRAKKNPQEYEHIVKLEEDYLKKCGGGADICGVWLWELDKFGYDLTAVGKTKHDAWEAMSEEYIKTYAKRNELDEAKCRDALLSPILDEDGEVDEYDEYNQFAELYRVNFIDMENGDPVFIKFGKVEWR